MKLTEKELNEFPIGTNIKIGKSIFIKTDNENSSAVWYEYREGLWAWRKSKYISEKDAEKVLIPNYTEYMPPKPILDDKEKEYLNNLIKPFRNEIRCIGKWSDSYRGEYIYFGCISIYNSFSLPFFKAGTMYKGMELDRAYSLEELGL